MICTYDSVGLLMRWGEVDVGGSVRVQMAEESSGGFGDFDRDLAGFGKLREGLVEEGAGAWVLSVVLRF